MGSLKFRERIARLIQDEAGRLSTADIDGFLAEALSVFSRDYPRVRVVDIAGTGAYQYDLPADWVEGFSAVVRLEYPVGQRPPVYLEADDYMVYRDTSGEKLLLVSHLPQSGETLRLTYTTTYTEAALEEIPQVMQEGVCLLAAALCCEALSRSYAQGTQPTIAVDAVDYGEKSDVYARRAKELQERYAEFMGKASGVRPASGVRDWDVNYPWGEDRLTHPKKQR